MLLVATLAGQCCIRSAIVFIPLVAVEYKQCCSQGDTALYVPCQCGQGASYNAIKPPPVLQLSSVAKALVTTSLEEVPHWSLKYCTAVAVGGPAAKPAALSQS